MSILIGLLAVRIVRKVRVIGTGANRQKHQYTRSNPFRPAMVSLDLFPVDCFVVTSSARRIK